MPQCWDFWKKNGKVSVVSVVNKSLFVKCIILHFEFENFEHLRPVKWIFIIISFILRLW